MAVIIRALTSNSDAEIVSALNTLVRSSAETGLLHESFDRNSANSFTRAWFAWCNALFGELIITLAKTHPQLLF